MKQVYNTSNMVRTRMAPSPTGKSLHIGNVATALKCYAFAKKHNGKFVVRVEDTDQKRVVKGSEERILESFVWLGLKPDESPKHKGPYGPYRQSERLDLYKKYAKELVEKGHAYYCDCSPERLSKLRKKQQKKGKIPRYDGICRDAHKKAQKNSVIRLKVPRSGKTAFTDIVRGKITFENINIDDQVLLKSDGFPTYHLAVVVDDYLMEISHVIRAEEWISSTPKHILIYNALGWSLPKFAHVPLLRNTDKSKLSKRKNPVWISWYKKQGYLPEAILNYLALMGWSHPDGKEIFSLDEFIQTFTLERVTTTGPVFDTEKLTWMNGEYIRKSQNSKLKTQLLDFIGEGYNEKLVQETVPLVKDRIKTLSEYLPMCEFFFKAPNTYEREVNKAWLQKALNILTNLETWDHDVMYNRLSKLAERLGVSKSKLFMDIRIAVTGKRVGPPIFESMEILGKRKSLKRIKIIS